MENELKELKLLFFFERACPKKKKDENGNVKITYRKEWVRCRLWFKDSDDLNEFMKIHCPIKWGPELFDTVEEFSYANLEREVIETTWAPYHTMTAKELGFK